MDEREPRVEVRRSARRRRTVTAYRERDTIVVLIPERMSKADERVFVTDMVRKVLAREAKLATPSAESELSLRAREVADRYLTPQLGHRPEPTSVSWVTNQQQRWGSCTPSTGAIRLSHRLRPMPVWVVDYVLLHEVTHLVESAHSPAFWALMDSYPQAERAKGFLEGWLASQGHPSWELDDVD